MLISKLIHFVLHPLPRIRKIIQLPFAILGFFLISLAIGCSSDENDEFVVNFDFDKIKERGKLIAITGFNAYSYFIYKGQPMGFEHDLVTKLADYLGVEVEFRVVKNIQMMFDMLNQGEGDLIAYNLTVTKKRLKKVTFSEHHHTARQVLVQRKPDNWRFKKVHQIERNLIRNPIDLIGQTVHVRAGSAHIARLDHLSEEIGDDINVIEANPEDSMEDLIRMVSEGEIEFTVADDNIAKLHLATYKNVDINTYISFPQRIAWAVRKNSVQLLSEINKWLSGMKKKSDYYVIYNKYYRNRSAFARRVSSEYFSQTGGKISAFDDLIKKYSKELNWDWRMLASLIYQESQFKSDVNSWAGARGLMQLMPATAELYGVEDLQDPHENLKAGISYLSYLDKFWSEMVPDSLERIKFVLASYNIGPGHIVDARNLAEKYGADPEIWFYNVEVYLLKKSSQRFYNDEVVKLGYAKGTETVKYVKEVLDRFEHYKQFIG
ncbi:transporter substrate-binding domain-containing protein [Bacteroidota bacterium]